MVKEIKMSNNNSNICSYDINSIIPNSNTIAHKSKMKFMFE